MQATEYERLDLEESIPEIVAQAINASEWDILRGLQASAHWEWHWIRGAESLVGLIVVSYQKNEPIYPNEAEDVMRSRRWAEFLEDFDYWELLEYDSGRDVYGIPAMWGRFINAQDSANPELGPKLLGRLLGACSLAQSVAPDTPLQRFPYIMRRPAAQQAFRQYIPVRSVAANADASTGRIDKAVARRRFTRDAGYDAEPRWISVLMEDRQRPVSLRFFEDSSADPLYVRHDVIRAFTRVRQRTQQIYLQRSP